MRKTAILLLAALFTSKPMQGQSTAAESPTAKEPSVVDQKLVEAREYLDGGLYDLADKRCRQVLALDPDNEAAVQGRALIRQARKEFSAMNAEIPSGYTCFCCPETYWKLPCDSAQDSARTDRAKAAGAMEKRLENIVVPPKDFASKPLREVVAWLQAEARRSDSNHDPALGDLEIRMEFFAVPEGKKSEQSISTTEAVIPGLPLGAEVDSVFFYVPPIPTTETTPVTLREAQRPLIGTLQLLASMMNMHLKLETGRATLIFGGAEPDDLMHTTSLLVPPSFIRAPSQDGADDEKNSHVDARTFLEASGVTFPPGAKAVYLKGASLLVMRNTSPNLDLFQTLNGSCYLPPTSASSPSPTPVP